MSKSLFVTRSTVVMGTRLRRFFFIAGELEHMMCQVDTKKTLIQKTLIRAQELADEKLYHMQQLMDTIDNKSRQLEFDAKTLGRY